MKNSGGSLLLWFVDRKIFIYLNIFHHVQDKKVFLTISF